MALGKIGSAITAGLILAAPAQAEERQDVDVTGGVNSPLHIETSQATLNQIAADYSACIGEVIVEAKAFKKENDVSQQDIQDFVDWRNEGRGALKM